MNTHMEETMYLELEDLEVECIIGDLAHEREVPQKLLVCVRLEISDDAAESDALADTVDYAALADKIRSALQSAKCRMIERAAKIVEQTCLAEKGVKSVWVKVTKSGAIPGLKSASCVIALALSH